MNNEIFAEERRLQARTDFTLNDHSLMSTDSGQHQREPSWKKKFLKGWEKAVFQTIYQERNRPNSSSNMAENK